MRNTEYITTSEKEARTGNTGLAKVAVHYSADTFVVKIATFAKPETVVRNLFKNYICENEKQIKIRIIPSSNAST